MNDKLLANIRFYFAQSVFMSSCHYKAYARLRKRRDIFSNIVVVISVSTLFVLIFQIIGLQQQFTTFLNIIAFVAMLLTGTSLSFSFFSKEDISLLMCNHKSVAEKYKALRDEYMTLIEEVMSNSMSDEDLRSKRNLLQNRYSSLGEYAPETTYEDYQSAQKGLGLDGNCDEEFTWNNDQINRLLPKELRLKY